MRSNRANVMLCMTAVSLAISKIDIGCSVFFVRWSLGKQFFSVQLKSARCKQIVKIWQLADSVSALLMTPAMLMFLSGHDKIKRNTDVWFATFWA